MSLNKRGLGKGLEALLADSSIGELKGSSAKTTENDQRVDSQRNTYTEIFEKSLARKHLLHDMEGLTLDSAAISMLLKRLIEDIARDSALLMESAEEFLEILNEFDSLVESL